jgi:hypothetical protein
LREQGESHQTDPIIYNTGGGGVPVIRQDKDKNEFAIGLKDDEHFRAMTKVGEFYTTLY